MCVWAYEDSRDPREQQLICGAASPAPQLSGRRESQRRARLHVGEARPLARSDKGACQRKCKQAIIK